MPNLASTLKSEIARLARKELKSEIQLLRKTVASHRSEIAALKRELKATQDATKRLSKQVNKGKSVEESPAAQSPRRGRRPAGFTAEGLLAIRKRLDFTQAQMAALLGVSALSVYKWESGQTTPRAAQQAKILSSRNIGKREAIRQITSQVG
jgi:DNA-binding transcriptional regulator YiaG